MARSAVLLFAASLACACGTAGLAEAASGPPGDPQRGLALARQFCSSCHLVQREDKGPALADAPTFLEIAARPGIDADGLVALVVAKPHPQMPEPPLSQAQLRDIAALILSLK